MLEVDYRENPKGTCVTPSTMMDMPVYYITDGKSFVDNCSKNLTESECNKNRSILGLLECKWIPEL